MSAPTTPAPAAPDPDDRRVSSGRTGPRRLVAALVAVLTVAGFALSGQIATAAAPPQAQAVGRFLDGSLGPTTLESLADVHDARATSPGTASAQNPLDVTLLGQLNAPLTGVINIPTSPAVVAGAVNQVAAAHPDGSSFGAAGAVSNQGGIEIGGANGPSPAVATINLSGSALPALPLTLPGAGDAAALGGITGSIGAVSAAATTKPGGAVSPAPAYNIAGLKLTLQSPALGAALAQLTDLLNPAKLPGLPDPISLPGVTVPDGCTFTTAVLAPISIAEGSVDISPTSGALTIDFTKLLAFLGGDINKLPANTDLLAFLLNFLTSPAGLARGLQGVLESITDPGQNRLNACLHAIDNQNPATQTLLGPLIDLLHTASSALTAGVSQLSDALGSTAGGSSPLAPVATGLAALIDIGVNVESGPGIQPVQVDPAYLYKTELAKTPNQATAVVSNQTLIRAVEINVLGAAGGTGAATLALANAAVGPSSAPAPRTTASQGVEGVSTQLPTGVPAGSAKPAGSPVLPLTLLGVAVLMAGAGAVAWKVRGRYS